MPVKLYWQKQSVDGIWLTGSSLPSPGLSSSPFHRLGKQSMGRENKLAESHMAGKWQNWDSSPGSLACQPLLLATAPSCPRVNSPLPGMLISWNLPVSLPHLHKSLFKYHIRSKVALETLPALLIPLTLPYLLFFSRPYHLVTCCVIYSFIMFVSYQFPLLA